ncbi:MAG: hypothetical protein P1U34_00600 [Coxiellaceae bacterium]|nr:hypothetical protein [Coxiellaceae bacterium]
MKLSSFIKQCKDNANSPKAEESAFTLKENLVLSFQKEDSNYIIFAHNKTGALDALAMLIDRVEMAAGTKESFSLQAKLVQEITEAFLKGYPEQSQKLSTSDKAALTKQLTSATTAALMLPSIKTMNPLMLFSSSHSVVSGSSTAVTPTTPSSRSL